MKGKGRTHRQSQGASALSLQLGPLPPHPLRFDDGDGVGNVGESVARAALAKKANGVLSQSHSKGWN